jgi:hypothetical protein
MLIRPDAYRFIRLGKLRMGALEERCHKIRSKCARLRERSRELIKASHFNQGIGGKTQRATPAPDQTLATHYYPTTD